MCDGDYETCDTIDPWSGMPDVTQNAYFFDNREEAEAFAAKQIWSFNPDIHADVYKVPEYTKTWAELEAEEAAKKAARKAKREATEKAKAEAAGMTVEEYRAEQNRQRLVRTLEKEIAELEKELARKKALLAKKRG